MLQSNRLPTIVVGVLIALFAVVLSIQFGERLVYGRFTDGRIILPTGSKVNTRGEELTHPEEVEDDFRTLYRAIVAYREKQGKLPVEGGGLTLLEFSDKPGYEKVTPEDLVSADVEKSDTYAQGARNHLIYYFPLRTTRPQHKPMPAFAKQGERDAWVYCKDYVRSNTVVYPNGTASNKETGFYIVLWSDGEIQRVSMDDVKYVGESDGLTMYFPGQAGLPKRALPGKTWNRLIEKAVPAGIVKGGANQPKSTK